MIRIQETDGRRVLVAELSGGSVAYVDADWTVGPVGAVPALIVGPETMQWTADPPVPVQAGTDPDIAAALALSAVAREAAAACEALAPSSVEVQGDGVIAAAVRELIGRTAHESSRRSDEAASPAAIVDCSGDPRKLADATRRLADGGTLVLAGEPLGRALDIDLYPDVHRRCLHLIGVGRPLDDAGGDRSGLDDAMRELFQGMLVDARPGAPIPAGAGWYRLSARDALE